MVTWCNKMPVVRVGSEAFALLIDEAKDLEISVRDLADTIILAYYGAFEEEGEDEDEEDEEAEEDEEDE